MIRKKSPSMGSSQADVTAALFTGGIDKHYATGLSTSLADAGLAIDVICNGEMESSAMQSYHNLRLLPLYKRPATSQNVVRKLLTFILVYARLLSYASTSSARIFHILWNYKFAFFDRTVLLFYYKLLGKRIILTAHNINAAERDGIDSLVNRWSLRVQYRLADHIFVHTEQMKGQLVQDFKVRSNRVSVIPFGVYDMVPVTSLTRAEARRRLGLDASDRTILFFGRITPYKGIDLLVNAFEGLSAQNRDYRLLIAGEPMKESAQHWARVRETIEQSSMRKQVLQYIRHIPDSEIELYFKAADALVLPYTHIFQSGVLFMAYSFGLPVIATDVGSFSQDVTPGVTGYLCRPEDPEDLARAVKEYFSSELFRTLDERRANLQGLIRARHSWKIVANRTAAVYAGLSQCECA